MQIQKLLKAALVLLILIAIVVILVYAKPFLVPLTFAALLAMLLVPVARWLEGKGAHKAVAALAAVLLLVGFFAGVFWLLGWQVSDLAGDAGQLKEQAGAKYQQLRTFISEKMGIPPEKQQQMLKEQQASSAGKTSGFISGFLAGLGGLLTNTILVLVYLFLFLFFRGHLKQFILRLVPADQRTTALDIVHNSQQVAQKYLGGLSAMIGLLWVLYGIGFSIAGVKSAVFFAILCGLLEIVPFVGNITGTALTLAMSLVQGGGTNLVVGILVTYGLVQFLQTYILEPLIVGAEVNLNPLFTILALVAGELLWGIPGMILAIPLAGIVKIVCDRVPPLQPFGFLLGAEKKKEDKGLKKKIKDWWKKVKG
ncbi:AI-2E family transporter [Paraflavisolibacter sp. H34]|uniref:AI-2E family transporter n=1 Tax=Huijunlia imazamoxiresistens TaxID=3127457 RepID=UPI003019F182